MDNGNTRYRLAPGTQVREEDFGLLFYTMNGPRLYFLSCGGLLDSRFFSGKHTMREWIAPAAGGSPGVEARLPQVERVLRELAKKGVIVEC